MSPLLPCLCFVEIWVARRIVPRRDYACSIIVPARNEAGNLGELLNRLPTFGTSREVVFVEGGSTDGTWETIAAEIQKRPGENLLALRQRGDGKGQAVRQAVDSCRGELIFIFGRRSFRGSGGTERPIPDHAEGKRGLYRRQSLCPPDGTWRHEASQLAWQQSVCPADDLPIGSTLFGHFVRN